MKIYKNLSLKIYILKLYGKNKLPDVINEHEWMSVRESYDAKGNKKKNCNTAHCTHCKYLRSDYNQVLSLTLLDHLGLV